MSNIFSAFWHGLALRLTEWHQREQAFAELSALDDRSLADIGLSRSDIPYILSNRAANVAPAKSLSRAGGNVPFAA